MKRTIAAILALCLAALTASCSLLDFKDHNKAIEKALMDSGLNIASASASQPNDGTAINLELQIVNGTQEFAADNLRTVLEIVLKDTPRAYNLWIVVSDPDGERINLEPAYVALGFPTQMELYGAEAGTAMEDQYGATIHPEVFFFGRNYTEKILNK